MSIFIPRFFAAVYGEAEMGKKNGNKESQLEDFAKIPQEDGWTTIPTKSKKK